MSSARVMAAVVAVVTACSPPGSSGPPARRVEYAEPIANQGGAAEVARTAPPRVPFRGAVPANTCYVDFLDIGSGLAILIRCADASARPLTILYDGGTNEPRLNKQFRLVYLLETGLGFMRGSRIDHLFHSHPHYDHHSDLISEKGVIELYDVKHVWDPAMHHTSKAYGCFLHAVTRKQKTTDLVYHPAIKCPSTRGLECDGAPIGYFQQAQVETYRAPSISRPTVAPHVVPFGVTGITGQILYSDPEAHEPNAAALVLKLQLFGVEVLLPADEEAGERRSPTSPPDAGSVEEFLVDPVRKARLRANIIAVPHHGSNTSSRNAFKTAAIWNTGSSADTYAVISSGKKEYGPRTLPDDENVRSWRAKLGAGRLLSTTTLDNDCINDPRKIAPAGDTSVAGCTNVEFEIKKGTAGGKIKKVIYWPIGPEVN